MKGKSSAEHIRALLLQVLAEAPADTTTLGGKLYRIGIVNSYDTAYRHCMVLKKAGKIIQLPSKQWTLAQNPAAASKNDAPTP